jgi:hypothetical protein
MRKTIESMFPHRLTDTRVFDIAQAMFDGFNRHCRLFRPFALAILPPAVRLAVAA